MSIKNEEHGIPLLIKELVTEAVEESGCSLDRIILFGSRARRDFDEKSDWDILVIIKEDISRDEKLKVFSKISRKLASHFIPSDIIVRSIKEVEKLKTYFHSVTKTAIEEGIVL